MQSNRPTAIVTGASAGLGAAIAQALAENGTHVLLCSRRSERLLAARDAIRASLTGPVDWRADAQADGRAGGRADAQADGRTDGRADGRADAQADGRTDGRAGAHKRDSGWTDLTRHTSSAEASEEYSAQPAEASAQPTEQSTQPAEQSAQPTEASTRREEQSAKSTEASGQPTEQSSADLPQLHCMAGDVTSSATAPALVGEARRLWGRLDVMVGNAGGPPPGTFEEHDDDAWRAAFELVLLSNIRLIRASLPLLRESPAGRIVLVASISAFRPVPRLALSNTLRPALAGLVRDLAVELGEAGILINAVSPGFFDTERSREVRASMAQMRGVPFEEIESELTAKVPLGRQGRPPELGALVAFLCSPRNGFVTGQTIVADGGLLQRG